MSQRTGHPQIRGTRSGQRAKHLLGAADALAVVTADVAVTLFAPLESGDGDPTTSVWLIVVVAPLVWVAACVKRRLYAARHITRRLDEFHRIVGASATALGALAVLAYALDAPVSRAWLGLLTGGAVAALTVEREAARRLFVRLRRAGRCRRPVIVVGANREAIELARMMDSDRSAGYEVLGFVTDVPNDLLDEHARDRVLGTVEQTPDIVGAVGAVGVVIAATAVTTETSNLLARVLTRSGVHVELSSTLRDVAAERLTVSTIGRFPMLYVEACRRHGWRAAAKRTFDLVLAITLLVLTAPALALLAVAVKVTSRGPVLFRQTRVGKDGVPFEVLKLRTMIEHAEDLLIDLTDRNEADGPLFKIRNDPRLTLIGGFLRRTSIDEIPQLWNVIRGDMSLVGPRPALPSETLHWTPELHSRLDVKPGITGMWQVNGRSASSWDDYVRLDLFYVENWSLVTDLAILARTIPTVLTRRGAL